MLLMQRLLHEIPGTLRSFMRFQIIDRIMEDW